MRGEAVSKIDPILPTIRAIYLSLPDTGRELGAASFDALAIKTVSV